MKTFIIIAVFLFPFSLFSQFNITKRYLIEGYSITPSESNNVSQSYHSGVDYDLGECFVNDSLIVIKFIDILGMSESKYKRIANLKDRFVDDRKFGFSFDGIVDGDKENFCSISFNFIMVEKEAMLTFVGAKGTKVNYMLISP